MAYYYAIQVTIVVVPRGELYVSKIMVNPNYEGGPRRSMYH